VHPKTIAQQNFLTPAQSHLHRGGGGEWRQLTAVSGGRWLWHMQRHRLRHAARGALMSLHCAEVLFASFLSGGFITAIVVNPPERKLEKRTSVHCLVGRALSVLGDFRRDLLPLAPRGSHISTAAASGMRRSGNTRWRRRQATG
jgi:hypothetical protein